MAPPHHWAVRCASCGSGEGIAEAGALYSSGRNPLLPQIALAPARDRGLHDHEVPLQGALPMSAAPPAEVLTGLQHPPQPQLARLIPSRSQTSAVVIQAR
jgi:hypothetical protein